jgi:hypothetical protein
LGFNLKLSTGWASLSRHRVLIAAAIFSKVVTRVFVRRRARLETRTIRT